MEQKLEKQYRTLAKRAESEFTEKRSRFIGYCAPVSSEEQALEFIGEIKSMHRTASHNVWAYSLRQSNLMRFTDDKEPSGTAGLPVLDVIKRGEIEDAAIVVTRYFGGTLLGTGGLVRAYGEGASLAVRASGISVMSPCRIYSLTCEYSEYDRIAQLLQKLGASVTDSEFTDSVSMTVALAQESGDRLCEEINELTRGLRKPEYIETKFEQTAVE